MFKKAINNGFKEYKKYKSFHLRVKLKELNKEKTGHSHKLRA